VIGAISGIGPDGKWRTRLVTTSLYNILLKPIPERPGIQPQKPRGFLLDPFRPLLRLVQEIFSIPFTSPSRSTLSSDRSMGIPICCCGGASERCNNPCTSVSVTAPPVENATTRSIKFSNSRPFPRHSCASRTCMTSELNTGIGFPPSWGNLSRRRVVCATARRLRPATWQRARFFTVPDLLRPT